jgi:hypothetical protein
MREIEKRKAKLRSSHTLLAAMEQEVTSGESLITLVITFE